MNIDDYKKAAIELFKNGKPTEEQWQELGEALLYVSETCFEKNEAIDNTIDPISTITCPICGCINIDHAPVCEGCGAEL